MAIKKKTQLNLSGSHHTLDSDNAFIGGFAYVTGSLTASVGISGSLVQGTNGLFVTLTGSLSGTSAGNPFIIAGPNVTVGYNSLGQWEVTGSAGARNFFTEIDSTHIYTTSSVAVPFLTSSTGADITGSVKVAGTVAFGNPTNSTVSNLSFVNGNSVLATGTYSHAEGVGSQATNDAAHAEGYSTIASGYSSHAEGWVAQAQGSYSHAEGSGSIAQGVASHAEGWLTTAKGSGSLAAGLGTIASGPVDGGDPSTTQAAFGKYNIESATALFVVGDGTSNANRHDALRLVSGSQGTSMQVTGSVNVSGPVSSSGAISAQGNLRIQGNTQLTGAVYLGNTLSASSNISTAGNLFVQGNEQVTGSIFVQTAVSASQGIFTQLTGALSGTAAGLPFLVNGGNMGGVTYSDATGQWTITGPAGTSVQGSNGDIQFNADGVHGAAPVGQTFAYYSASFGMYPAGTLVAPTASINNALLVAGINLTPIVKQATTSGPGGTSNIPSGSFLSFTNFIGSPLGNYSIAAFDFTIVAVAQTSDNYASWNFTATGIKDSTGATKLIDYLEVSQGSSGSDGDTWAVNVYDNMSVGLTGSTSQTVQWFMKASMKAALSGSGNDIY